MTLGLPSWELSELGYSKNVVPPLARQFPNPIDGVLAGYLLENGVLISFPSFYASFMPLFCLFYASFMPLSSF